jgi:hypothetical protein
MAKHKLSWDEMRPHMIAGAFWWGAAFITWEFIRKTYDYLHKNLGGTTAILIDVAAIVVTFFVLLTLIRWWIGPKAGNGKKLRKVGIHPENTEEGVSYKNKVRIAIKNETSEELHIKNPVWISNGVVSLELPPRMKMQLEKFKESWSKDQWIPEEVFELLVPPGFTFRTWIGLHEKLSEKDFGRVQQNEQFGTLLLAVDGDDLRIPI